MRPRVRSLPRDQDPILQQARAWSDHASLASLTPELLRCITQTHGVDFATALLYDRLRSAPQHAPIIERIEALQHSAPTVAPQLNAAIVIVPGALYIERPDMGGDGRVVREIAADFGISSDLIPLASFGGVESNALRILDWMRAHLNERIIFVSLSKGGADLKHALAHTEAPRLFRDVVAWINVCGPVQGTPMTNWILASGLRAALVRWKFHWQRRDFRFVTELRYGAGSVLHPPPLIPDSMRMISLIGFPLREHLTTRFARFCHRTIAASHGPNDGTAPLADLLSLPGQIFPVWGMDHYFRPETDARSLVAATLLYLCNSSR